MIYKWVLYIARNRYIEVPSLHRKVLIISIFLAKNLHMSKKSSTFVQLLRGANGECTPQAEKPSGSAAPDPKEKTDKAGEQDAESVCRPAKSTKDDPRHNIGGARCESLHRPKEKNGWLLSSRQNTSLTNKISLQR